MEWDGIRTEGTGWGKIGSEGMVHLMVEMWLDRQDDHVALHHQLHVIHCEIHAPESNKHSKNSGTGTGSGKRKCFCLESSVGIRIRDPG